jgi:hypothetical protein
MTSVLRKRLCLPMEDTRRFRGQQILKWGRLFEVRDLAGTYVYLLEGLIDLEREPNTNVPTHF